MQYCGCAAKRYRPRAGLVLEAISSRQTSPLITTAFSILPLRGELVADGTGGGRHGERLDRATDRQSSGQKSQLSQTH